MKLLGAEDIKTAKDQAVAETSERIRKLQLEESTSSRRLNDALAREAIEIGRIDAGLKSAQSDFDRVSKDLHKEVAALEARKREALAPTREREIAVAKAEESLREKQEEFLKKAETLELRFAEALGARGNYERKLRELEKYREEIDDQGREVVRQKEDADRFLSAKESRFNDEKERLRKYFEAEDEKLNEKILVLRDLEKKLNLK